MPAFGHLYNSRKETDEMNNPTKQTGNFTKGYDHHNIEKRWQSTWYQTKIYEPDIQHVTHPFYNLMMFPYPSAEGLHVGNLFAFVGVDIQGR